MKTHAFCKPVWYVECFVKRVIKEFQEGLIAKTDPVDIICPIDEEPAPDHDGKHWKIDPVKPTDGEGVFFDDGFLRQNS